ncbi:hypothetical protein M885DRAFT_305313 [Pelagophyceae sp. CCMP2097]|nr:hypothetical protein M885DRAFT_305313 [Pelagophyceae sp. CCMP2097]
MHSCRCALTRLGCEKFSERAAGPGGIIAAVGGRMSPALFLWCIFADATMLAEHATAASGASRDGSAGRARPAAPQARLLRARAPRRAVPRRRGAFLRRRRAGRRARARTRRVLRRDDERGRPLRQRWRDAARGPARQLVGADRRHRLGPLQRHVRRLRDAGPARRLRRRGDAIPRRLPSHDTLRSGRDETGVSTPLSPRASSPRAVAKGARQAGAAHRPPSSAHQSHGSLSERALSEFRWLVASGPARGACWVARQRLALQLAARESRPPRGSPSTPPRRPRASTAVSWSRGSAVSGSTLSATRCRAISSRTWRGSSAARLWPTARRS